VSFFNKKEEVIEIQLTQFGKLALSQGKFRPFYYAFYDDDMLYDLNYAGVSEPQNDTQDRLLDFAKLKPQSVIYGVETRLLETNAKGKQLDGTQQIRPHILDKNLLLRNCLYDTEPGSQDIPDFYIHITEKNVKFDTQAGIKKSTGNFVITEVDNIKCTVNITRSTILPYQETNPPPENLIEKFLAKSFDKQQKESSSTLTPLLEDEGKMKSKFEKSDLKMDSETTADKKIIKSMRDLLEEKKREFREEKLGNPCNQDPRSNECLAFKAGGTGEIDSNGKPIVDCAAKGYAVGSDECTKLKTVVQQQYDLSVTRRGSL
jgi:hypothetical protein